MTKQHRIPNNMDQQKSEVLLIFVKNPELGRVKTRLAETIGKPEALKVYRSLLRITKNVADQIQCVRQVWYSKFIPSADLWDSGNYIKKQQQGSDLGQRMSRAFKEAFDEGYEKVVIIGSDCAELSSEILKGAFQALDSKNLVVGPSQDGGYYLLGMTTFYPALFEDIAWSTGSVFEQTKERADQLGLTKKILTLLNDIDTEKDMNESDQKLSHS